MTSVSTVSSRPVPVIVDETPEHAAAASLRTTTSYSSPPACRISMVWDEPSESADTQTPTKGLTAGLRGPGSTTDVGGIAPTVDGGETPGAVSDVVATSTPRSSLGGMRMNAATPAATAPTTPTAATYLGHLRRP